MEISNNIKVKYYSIGVIQNEEDLNIDEIANLNPDYTNKEYLNNLYEEINSYFNFDVDKTYLDLGTSKIDYDELIRDKIRKINEENEVTLETDNVLDALERNEGGDLKERTAEFEYLQEFEYNKEHISDLYNKIEEKYLTSENE